MNKDLLNVMGSFSETALDCIEKQNEEIEDLKKENARLKDKIERSFKIIDDKLTNLNLEYGINNEFREEYDELWEILKEN